VSDPNDLYVIIMAGGRGTRFWPRSRRSMPKQCLSLDGGRTLIQKTVDRVRPLAPAERVLVITAADMADAIAAQLPELPAENILVEPEGRNTAPCVGWGVVEVRRRAGGEAVIAVLPADHLIRDEDGLRGDLAAAAAAASATGALVTLGLTPTRPETGFGYLELGASVGDWGGRTLREVARFVEKPDVVTAEAYLAGGNHLWNAGMFVFTVGAAVAAFEAHLPDMWSALSRLEQAPEALPAIYPTLEKISFDFGIMERAPRVITCPSSPGWSDVGSWTAAGEHLPASPLGRALVRAGIAIDAGDCVVHAPEKVVALVGVRDLVIVDAGDALLVCRADQAQRVRDVIDALGASGLDDLL